ncbi:MAG: hypothetical protein ACXWPG_19745, partial [Ktedonobacteraceae bacterium]
MGQNTTVFVSRANRCVSCFEPRLAHAVEPNDGVGRHTCVIPEALGTGAGGSRHLQYSLQPSKKARLDFTH